jgi:hypothetical protein
MTYRSTRLAGALALAAALPAQADSQPAADPVGLRGDFSGTFYNTEQPGQGVMVELRDRGQATLAWFTFDAAGQPMWLFGIATLDGNVLRAPMSRVAGGRFPPAFDPANVQATPWGEVSFTVAGCNSGTLRWTPSVAGFGAGQMELARLTAVHGTRCNSGEEFSEVRTWSLERGNQDFEVVFADKPPGENEFYELDYVYEPLPAPIAGRRGMRVSGNNHSDDLLMLVKREVRGLIPNALYRIEMEAEIASNVPTGCSGVGGSPGDGVYMKLGASTQEPMALTAADGWQRLNVDVGQQAEGGANGRVVGTLANSHSCDVSPAAPWELRTLSTLAQQQQLRVRADADGALWIFAGSDSAFEGRTDWYLAAATLRLAQVSEDSPQ